MKKTLFKNNQSGVALILAVMLMSLVLFLVLYFMSFSVMETKISGSQFQSTKAYYLAESAVNDIIYQLNNDPVWHDPFIASSTWQKSFSRSNIFGETGVGYTAFIKNDSPAHAVVYATSSVVGIDGKVSQRVVRVNVYRAIGTAAIGERSMFADGSVSMSNSDVTLDGGLHSNSSITFANGSEVNIDGVLAAVGNVYNNNSNSDISVSSTTYAANLATGKATNFTMPAVDFYSTSSASLYNQAARRYTATQFMDLLKTKKGHYTMGTGITYVTGNVNIDGCTKNNKHYGDREDDDYDEGDSDYDDDHDNDHDDDHDNDHDDDHDDYNDDCRSLKLHIPGALVVNGSLTINVSSVEITNATGTVSGLFSTGNMTLSNLNRLESSDGDKEHECDDGHDDDEHDGDDHHDNRGNNRHVCDNNIDAVIYTNGNLVMNSVGKHDSHHNGHRHHHGIFINGGIAARNITLNNCENLHIGLFADIIGNSLPVKNYSPVISTDHWEEQY